MLVKYVDQAEAIKGTRANGKCFTVPCHPEKTGDTAAPTHPTKVFGYGLGFATAAPFLLDLALCAVQLLYQFH